MAIENIHLDTDCDIIKYDTGEYKIYYSKIVGVQTVIRKHDTKVILCEVVEFNLSEFIALIKRFRNE